MAQGKLEEPTQREMLSIILKKFNTEEIKKAKEVLKVLLEEQNSALCEENDVKDWLKTRRGMDKDSKSVDDIIHMMDRLSDDDRVPLVLILSTDMFSLPATKPDVMDDSIQSKVEVLDNMMVNLIKRIDESKAELMEEIRKAKPSMADMVKTTKGIVTPTITVDKSPIVDDKEKNERENDDSAFSIQPRGRGFLASKPSSSNNAGHNGYSDG